MTKSKRLRLCISELINSVHGNTYYMQATDNAKFPYIVYEYSVRYSDYKGIGRLEINVWDLNQSSESAEEIADRLESTFQDVIYADGLFILKIYKESRLPILDENKNIRRVRLIFEIQYYTGKE